MFFRRDDLLPEAPGDCFDQFRSLLQRDPAIACRGKFLLNAGGLFRVQVPQFTAQ